MEETLIKKNLFKDVLLSTIIALVVSIILILLFALVIKLFDISENAIRPVNIVIKTLSIFIGIFSGVRNCNAVALKGMLIGLTYYLISFLLFSALSGNCSMENIKIADVVFAIITGLIGSIVKVAVKKTCKTYIQ